MSMDAATIMNAITLIILRRLGLFRRKMIDLQDVFLLIAIIFIWFDYTIFSSAYVYALTSFIPVCS